MRNMVLPYQELLGNYNELFPVFPAQTVLPYQELLGNYNLTYDPVNVPVGFTIPRTARELQHLAKAFLFDKGFTIPRTARELQRKKMTVETMLCFTIPRTAKRLQQWVN